MSQQPNEHAGSKPFDVLEWLKIRPAGNEPSTPINSDQDPTPDRIIQNARVRRSKSINQ